MICSPSGRVLLIKLDIDLVLTRVPTRIPVDNKTCSEITWRYVISLQSFFKINNIKYIFFEGDINKEGFLDKTCKIAELVDFDYFYQVPFLDSAGNRVTECNHPNAEVQIEWADKLYNFIGELY